MPNHSEVLASAFGSEIDGDVLDAIFAECKWFNGWFRDDLSNGVYPYDFLFESMISDRAVKQLISRFTGLSPIETIAISDARIAHLNSLS